MKIETFLGDRLPDKRENADSRVFSKIDTEFDWDSTARAFDPGVHHLGAEEVEGCLWPTDWKIMRERSSRVFVRLSPGSTPFFLPPWGAARKGQQSWMLADIFALCASPGDWPTVDSVGPLSGSTACSDGIEVRQRAKHTPEEFANLRRQIEVAATSKRRRAKSRSKRRS